MRQRRWNPWVGYYESGWELIEAIYDGHEPPEGEALELTPEIAAAALYAEFSSFSELYHEAA